MATPPRNQDNRGQGAPGQQGQHGQQGQQKKTDPGHTGEKTGGPEIQSPPIHRTDSTDATMGTPTTTGSTGANVPGRDANQDTRGETMTQDTEFTNENEATARQDRARNAGSGTPRTQSGQTDQSAAGQTENT